MHCEKSEMLLPLLVFDELADAERTELMAHLAGCASCSENLGDLRVTMNLLREGFAATPAPVLSAERRAKLMKRLASPPKVKRRRRAAPLRLPAWVASMWRFRRPIGIAAGLALITGIGAVALSNFTVEWGHSNSSEPVAAKDGRDDTWLATTYLDEDRRSRPEWEHISQLNGVYLKLPGNQGSYAFRNQSSPDNPLSDSRGSGQRQNWGRGIGDAIQRDSVPMYDGSKSIASADAPVQNWRGTVQYQDGYADFGAVESGGGRDGRNGPHSVRVVQPGVTAKFNESLARFDAPDREASLGLKYTNKNGEIEERRTPLAFDSTINRPVDAFIEAGTTGEAITGSGGAPRGEALGDRDLSHSQAALGGEKTNFKRSDPAAAGGRSHNHFYTESEWMDRWGAADDKEASARGRVDPAEYLNGLALEFRAGYLQNQGVEGRPAAPNAASTSEPKPALPATPLASVTARPAEEVTATGVAPAFGTASPAKVAAQTGRTVQPGGAAPEDSRQKQRLDDLADRGAAPDGERYRFGIPTEGKAIADAKKTGAESTSPSTESTKAPARDSARTEGDKLALLLPNLERPKLSKHLDDFEKSDGIATKGDKGSGGQKDNLLAATDKLGRLTDESRPGTRDEPSANEQKLGEQGQNDPAGKREGWDKAKDAPSQKTEPAPVTFSLDAGPNANLGDALPKPRVLSEKTRDLNSALSNTSSGGSSGGKQSATTLFSDEDTEGEQATREEKIEQITTLIQDSIGEQANWAAYGGEVGSLREVDNKLIIKTTPKQHREINRLLTMLREDKPVTGKTGDAYIADAPEDRAVAAQLQKKISIDSEGKKLKGVIQEIQEKTGSNLVVNWAALEAAGVEEDLPVALSLKEIPAEKAMKLVLQQAGGSAQLEPLDFEISDGVVKLSTRRDLQRATETRVYDVRDLLAFQSPNLQPEGLLEEITAEKTRAAAEFEAEAQRQAEAAKRAEAARLAEVERARTQEIALAKQRAEAEARQAEAQAQDAELQPAATFRIVPVNPWTLTQQDAQSTFALDVDTASYTLGRRYINRGYLPPAGSVRMEEYINAFDYNYSTQCDDVFNIHAEAAPAPFAPSESANTKLLKVGVKGKVIGRDGRKPANLIFVVDTSGSMARADRLPMIQHSLELLTGQLTPSDTVSLVTFGSDVLTLLDRTPASQKETIINAVKSLQANGPTNLLKGVQAGYRLAEQAHKSGAINRLIVCSDGIATLGETEADTILSYVENYRKQGISCTTVGFGAGAYDDDMMEKLANKGDGAYYFVDSRREAKRVFVDELTATLQTIAKDAKIQVEFNPAVVRRYRLIGYENRAIADKDFRNDTIDAGEVGSGQSSTALYEIELVAGPVENGGRAARADLGTVYVRYRNADTEKIEEISQRLTSDLVRERTAASDPRFYLAACAAEFAEVLRESSHAAGGKLERVQTLLEQVTPQLPLDEKAAELLDLVRKAQGLPRAP